jgi:hypothetical protein
VIPNAVFGITVDRLCRVRSGSINDEWPFPLDDEGFLSPLAVQDGFLDPSAVQDGSSADLTNGALVPIQVAARSGALILLGEPGVGKSTEFQRLTGGSDSSVGGRSAPKVTEVNAADLTQALIMTDGIHIFASWLR